MIKIGPAGSGGLGNLKGIQKVARMKLDCMEVEFTYGVRMSIAQARETGALLDLSPKKLDKFFKEMSF